MDIALDNYPQKAKPEWEVLYYWIGQFLDEIRMRQRVKKLSKTAQTVADVVALTQGTYFDAHFVSEDRQKWCRSFNEDNYSATMMTNDETDNWVKDPSQVNVSSTVKVKHLRFREDIHTFLLFEL